MNRHRSLAPLLGKAPSVGHGAFVAPSAAVIGDVRLGSQASVFYGSVVRGELWVQAAAASGLQVLLGRWQPQPLAVWCFHSVN